MLVRPMPLLNFFVALVMLSIGLRVSGGELLAVMRNRALFIKILVANCVLIPSLGPLLVKIFPLTTDASGHPAAGCYPGDAHRSAIHPHGEAALGVCCRHDLRPFSGEHRHNAFGRRGHAPDRAAQ